LLLIEEEGYKLVRSILEKIKDIGQYQTVYEETTGFNFLHKMVIEFCKLSKNNWSIAK
jgi:hypothetical protein